MAHLVHQPWWVDLAVVLLPFVVFGVVQYMVRGRNCFECGHKANQFHMRRCYCDRCFRKLFGEAVVASQRIAVEVPPQPAASPAPRPAAAVASANGKSHGTRAKQRHRARKKKAG